MRNGNIDLFNAILKTQVGKSAEKIGQAGSDMAENQAFGGMLGGLLGQYGVPALLGLIPGVGPVLAAVASAAGAGLGAYAGSEIGRQGTDMPETEYLQSKGQEVTDMLKDKSLTAGLTSAATAGASAVSMGADKYAAHLKNPLGLKSMTEKLKEDPSLGTVLEMPSITSKYKPAAILETPSRVSRPPVNLVTPPAVNVGGVIAPTTNVAGGGQLGSQLQRMPSLLNYVPNLGGLNVGSTGIAPYSNPLLNQPLLNLPALPQTPLGNIHQPYMPPII